MDNEFALLTPEAVTMEPDNDLVEMPHYDILHGKRLSKGDRVILTWPDGSTSVEIIEMERRLPPYAYGGRIYQAYDDRAFIRKDVSGAPVRIYLRWQPTVLAVRQETPFTPLG